MTIQPPDTSAKLVTGGGLVDPVWLRWFRGVWRLLKDQETEVTALQTNKAAVSQTWRHAVLIEAPANQAYTYLRLGVSGYISTVITQTASGTCTVTVSIDGNDLLGDANSASSTIDEVDHGVDNLMVDGSDIVITVSSNSSAADLSVTLVGQRTLEG